MKDDSHLVIPLVSDFMLRVFMQLNDGAMNRYMERHGCMPPKDHIISKRAALCDNEAYNVRGWRNA